VFDHVTIRVSDRSTSERFYDTVLATLGIEKTHADESFVEWNDFSLAEAGEGERVTRRLHVGFVAPSREHVGEFWRVGSEAGYRDDGAPGPRPEYGDDYYGAFLLDPDGNSAEAVHHDSLREGGGVDHVWLRVGDVAAAKRFYETIAPYARFRLTTDNPERAQFAGETGSFSVVAGDPTVGLHMAFAASEREPVHGFHHAALAAGYRDNGAPGERPDYGPGYYAAFVLDPDGNNIELVDHGA
jgi:catechol 2,3-dioxygenase-like lactoylglutathione lyase family enzyme